MPHPQILNQYEQVCPGSASRIISMAEKQSKHRRELERMVIESNTKNERRGMDYAFYLIIIFVVSGLLLILTGKEISGFITLIISAIVPLVNYFITKKQEQKDLIKKERQVAQRRNDLEAKDK